jgi:hypothetical protein
MQIRIYLAGLSTKKVVSKYLKITDAESNRLVLGAQQSYADWPEERDLRLNDVARYIIITRYVETRDVKDGVGPDRSCLAAGTVTETRVRQAIKSGGTPAGGFPKAF